MWKSKVQKIFEASMLCENKEIAALLRSRKGREPAPVSFLSLRRTLTVRIRDHESSITNTAQLSGICYGTPGRSRTYNLILRTDLLYPVKLPRRIISGGARPSGLQSK